MKMSPLALLLAALPLCAQLKEIPTTQKDQQSLAVTIYNENLALVKDTREVRLPKGEVALAFQEVSAQIRPETALLRDITHPEGFWVAEQNFDFDLLTPQKLLDKYVGEKVGIITTQREDNGKTTEKREEALVLATNNGTVLQFPDRIETSYVGRIVFPKVPENLRARPTLVISLNSPVAATQKLELSYLTGGLAWRADYVANLASDEKTMDLSGWVTLTNTSGVAYPNATLQLVAGDVNRVQPKRQYAYMAKNGGAPPPAPPPQMQEENLFEYHLYTLDRPTTMKADQTKQVALLSASSIQIRKEYLLRGESYYYQGSYGEIGAKLKVGVFVEFDNREANRMGMPLPKGVVRVYKRDSEGRAQFIGEDAIDHTPRNETVRLKLGDAFDVTARRKQTDYKSLGAIGKYHYNYETAFEVDLKNAKKEAVTVSVLEPINGDWEIIQQSHPHTKESAGAAKFKVTVPAEGIATLTYRVRTKW
jgi:hypothetical protein